MIKPKVSIVIPVYNGSNYMREAIDSALAQTYENCETIVVNDGSTDNTEEIALSYGDKIRYFKKENGGVASAVNLAIREMKGEYFSWLSHDDIYYPHKVETQIRALMENGDMQAPLYSSWDILWMSENKKTSLPPEYRFSKKEREKGVIPVLFGLVHGCSMLIHKSHFERVGLFNEKLLTSQDYDMWFRIFRNQKIVYLEETLIIARIHNGQGSHTIEQFQSNCEEIQMDMLNRLERDEIFDLFGSSYQMYYHMMIMAKKCKWNNCIEKWIPKFLEETEPQATDVLKDLQEAENLVLYCAGKNGRRLYEELHLYGIEASAFSDGNQELWDTEIGEIKCIPPKEISKDAYIIVTKDYPEDVVEYLKNLGYEKVTGYDEIVKKLYRSIPIKERVKLFVNVDTL